MKITNLEKWLYLVRRIEEHREEKAVRELQKLYRSLIKDLRKVMGNIYADYADPETGKLTYADLHRQGLDARLLEEVAAHVSSVSSEESRIIRETVEQTYANTYSGMVQAVEQAVDREDLHEVFASVDAVKPEVIRAAVNNPVHGLTLPDQLEKNRADIVWGIKQAVGVGLSEGDNYTTMAKRIQKELVGPDGSGGSYSKAVRIARTEAHRVREEGNLDAAQGLTEKLEPAGVTMVKTWHTMKDERVRPNRARKTKGGWKYSKGGKYDHQKMEGVQVPINEVFTLPSGAKTQAPGKSGVAGEDINCRCFLSYDVVGTASVTKASRKHAIQDDNFETINNTKGDSIRPASLRKNLKKSSVGRETLQYIEEQNISIRLLYGMDNPRNELGFYDGFDDQIVIFADATKTTQKTAEIICHEVLHRRLGNRGTLEEEIKCWEIELLHRNGFLTQQDKDRILKSVKELYPELE